MELETDLEAVLEEVVRRWPVPYVALAAIRRVDDTFLTTTAGDVHRVLPVASVTILVATYATLVAVEEETVSLAEETRWPGVTLRHLLSHAGGIAPDRTEAIRPPGVRRIYSNAGFETVAEHVATRAGLPFGNYLTEAVLEPLEMQTARLAGTAPAGLECSLADLCGFVGELLDPTLVSTTTLTDATSVQFPSLRGILPGFGMQDPNPWGLGFEIRATKSPHWTGTGNSAATFGHFGQSGSFLWVDPAVSAALAVVTDRPFGNWARRAWPELSDRVLDHL